MSRKEDYKIELYILIGKIGHSVPLELNVIGVLPQNPVQKADFQFELL